LPSGPNPRASSADIGRSRGGFVGVVLSPPAGSAPAALLDAAAKLVLLLPPIALPDLDRLPYREIGPPFPEPEGLEPLTGLALGGPSLVSLLLSGSRTERRTYTLE